jgi:hypothetical protein
VSALHFAAIVSRSRNHEGEAQDLWHEALRAVVSGRLAAVSF